MNSRKRVLFFAEPATLAHVVRPVVLARTLDRERFDVSVATGPDFRDHVEEAGLAVRELDAIGTRAYLAAVAAGRPVFPYAVLERYVDDDLRIIAAVRPDVVVGDFRLSLAVSARMAKLPYLAIANAYWSPHARAPFDIPVHAATRWLGVPVPNAIFHAIRPLVFAHHSLPMHRLRRRHGLPSLGLDLRGVFTEGDVTLFADVPEFVPGADGGTTGRYVYIGPVTWAPNGPLPDALDNPGDARPLVYVSLGSSGRPALLRDIVTAVLGIGCRAAVTAPSGALGDIRDERLTVAPMLPGDRLAAMSKLVICNGGSPAVHQALQQGTPVLGLPENLDQLLNMHFVGVAGAGLSVRADQAAVARVQAAARRVLEDPRYRDNAKRVQQWFRDYPGTARFVATIERVAGLAEA